MNLKLLKIFAVIAFFISLVWVVSSILKIVSTEAPDFKVLWSIAQYLRPGKNLYLNPNISIPNPYPPVTSLFYLPFTFLEYSTAQAIFVFLIFTSIVITIFLSLRLVVGRVSIWIFLAAFSLVFLSFPVKFSLGMGQQNSIAFLFVLLAYFFWKKNISSLSGIFLALGVSFKPVLGFIALFFFVEKAWKVIFWSLFTGMIETAMVFSIARLNLFIDWIKQSLLVIPLNGREIYYNQGFAGFVSRLTQNMTLIKNSVFLFSLSIISAVYLTVKKRDNKNLIFSLFIISTLLIDTLSWQHHFVWLIFPFIVLTYWTIKAKSALLSGLIVLAYFLVSWNFKAPANYPLILISNQFYGAAILWGINVYLLTKPKLTS